MPAQGDDLYETAVAAFMSSAHQASSPQALAASAARRKKTYQDMNVYWQRLTNGKATLATEDGLPNHMIHITGTKGKGSTACFCEALLRHAYGCRTGLFTSPHLLDIRERIRIGGKLVSKQVFGRAYWEIRNNLEANKDLYAGEQDEDNPLPILPGYFRMLTLLAFYIFRQLQVPLDVLVIEVGMGGRYDATNLWDYKHANRNIVCGVTVLDYDHVRVLGSTLEEIAWEKGGIFATLKQDDLELTPHPKTSTHAVATAQQRQDSDSGRTFFVLDSNPASVLDVFRSCAALEGRNGSLQAVDASGKVVRSLLSQHNLTLGLAGDHQYGNAALAVELCRAVKVGSCSEAQEMQALSVSSWPGRCQQVSSPKYPTTSFCLDGAHTEHSMTATAQWYASKTSRTPSSSALIFYCSHERNPIPLLRLLLPLGFARIYFCPLPKAGRPSPVAPPSLEDMLSTHDIKIQFNLLPKESNISWTAKLECLWRHLSSEMAAAVIRSDLSLHEALQQKVTISDTILVTGSLYLVGAVLEWMEWQEESSTDVLRAE